MITLNPTNKNILLVTQGLYLAFIASFIFSSRAVNNIILGMIIFTGLVINRNELVVLVKKYSLLIIGLFLFYIVQLISLLQTPFDERSVELAFKKTGLLFIPLAFVLTGNLVDAAKKKLLGYYCIFLLAASLFCLGMAGWKYSQTGHTAVFYYHELVSPLDQQAVYFSIYVFIAIIFLLEELSRGINSFTKTIQWAIVIFLSVFLFLLSSKFVITAYLASLLYYLVMFIRKYKRAKPLLVVAAVLVTVTAASALTIPNPVSKRFREVINGDINFIKQEKFTPADYFTDVQFRLLQCRFVTEILNDSNKWRTGVGLANSKKILHQKYVSANMYTGDPVKGDTGFFFYDTQSQWLQSLLETGVPGAAVFAFICFALISMAVKNKSSFYWLVIAVMLAYSFLEPVLSFQFGRTFFIFFPIFLNAMHPASDNKK